MDVTAQSLSFVCSLRRSTQAWGRTRAPTFISILYAQAGVVEAAVEAEWATTARVDLAVGRAAGQGIDLHRSVRREAIGVFVVKFCAPIDRVKCSAKT